MLLLLLKCFKKPGGALLVLGFRHMDINPRDKIRDNGISLGVWWFSTMVLGIGVYLSRLENENFRLMITSDIALEECSFGVRIKTP